MSVEKNVKIKVISTICPIEGDEETYELWLQGVWLKKNGKAIYGTRPLYPYAKDNIRYTQSKDGKHKYEITLLEEGEYAKVKEIKKL